MSGFDPRGASHYHALYKKEAAKHSLLTGAELDVGARKRLPKGSAAWTVGVEAVDGLDQINAVQTHYEFMGWDDVVRGHWPKRWYALWAQVVATTLFNLRHGSLLRMLALSWPPALALFAPFMLVCAIVLVIPATALAVFFTVAKAGGVAWFAGLAASVAVVGLWRLSQRLEARFNMYWLVRSYAFTAKQAQDKSPELDARLDLLACRLVERVRQGQDDEVLLVGHSSGAMMAVSVLARALQLEPALLKGPVTVSLLTLGQCIPMLGLLPMAQRFRGELQQLAAASNLTWIDFSSPADGSCFALSDPFNACGLPSPALDFKLLNPRFAALFDDEKYRELKRDKLLLHFQYLCCAGKPGGYSYFDITAGGQLLKDRFANEPSVTDYADLRFRPLAAALLR